MQLLMVENIPVVNDSDWLIGVGRVRFIDFGRKLSKKELDRVIIYLETHTCSGWIPVLGYMEEFGKYTFKTHIIRD